MVSPFYLGSNPEEYAQGSYPGSPISGGSKRFNAPPEFVSLTDDFDALWDKFVAEANNAINLPQLYLDNQKKAWKSLFTIAGGFEDYAELDPYERSVSGDPEEFYKASDFKIDLIETFKNPGQQLKDIWKAAYNTEDMRREGRDRLMRAMVFGETFNSTNGLTGNLLDASIDSYKERFEALGKRTGNAGPPPQSLNLLSLLPGQTIVYHEELKDTPASKAQGGTPQDKRLFRTNSAVDFGRSFINYTRNEDSASKGPIGFRGLVNQAGVSMTDIFSSSATQQGGTRPDQLIINAASSLYAPGSTQHAQAVTQLQEAYDRFADMQQLSSKLGKLYAGKSAPVTAASRNLNLLETARVTPGLPGSVNIGNIASQGEVKAAGASLKVLGGSLVDIAGQVDKVKNHYINNPNISQREAVRVQKWAAKMNDQLETLAKSVNPNADASTLASWSNPANSAQKATFQTAWENAAADPATRKKIAGRLTRFTKSFNGYDFTNTGLNTEFTKIFVDHHIIPTKGISRLSSAAAIASEHSFGRQIQMYTLAARDSYIRNNYTNMYTTLQSGKVVPILYKSRFFDLLPNYTPHGIVKNFLNANHYFGLSVDPLSLKGYETWVAAGKPPHQYSLFYRPGNAFVHKLSNSKNFGFILENRFTIDLGNLGSIKTAGGSHFAAVSGLNFFRKLADGDPAEFHNLVWGNASASGLARLNALTAQGLSQKDAFIAALLQTNSPGTFLADFGHIPFGSPEDFYKDLTAFKAWMRSKHFDVFDQQNNFDPNKMGNLGALLTWLQKRSDNPSYYDITAKTMGLVQKLTQRLNVLQENVYNLNILGFRVGKAFFWQQQVTSIIYNKLAAVWSKILARFAGGAVVGGAAAATGGLALLITPLIERLIYFISTNVTGKISKGISGLMHGDIRPLGNAVEDSFIFILKVIAFTTLAVALIVAIPVGFVNFLVANISPKAPYAYNNIQPNIGVGEIDGTGEVIPGACPNKCILKGGGSVTEISYAGLDDVGTAARGHGSNQYWSIVVEKQRQEDPNFQACSLKIPIIDRGGFYGPTEDLDAADDISNICSESSFPGLNSYSPNYGKAWDIGAAPGTVVCAPALSGVSYWIVGTTTTTFTGAEDNAMMDLAGFDANDNLIYKLKLLHLAIDSAVEKNTRVEPGDGVGTVYNWVAAGPHLHVELQNAVSDEILAPEESGICY